MVDDPQDLWCDKHFANIVGLWLFEQLKDVLNAKNANIEVAFLQHQDMVLQILCNVLFSDVQLVRDELDNFLNLLILLEIPKEDKLDVFVALQTLRLLVTDVELEDLLDVPLDPLAVRVLQICRHYDREERAAIVDGFLHTDVVHEELEAEDAQLDRVWSLDGETEDVKNLHDEGSAEVVLSIQFLLDEHIDGTDKAQDSILALNHVVFFHFHLLWEYEVERFQKADNEVRIGQASVPLDLLVEEF